MFNLEKAINNWRKELQKHPGLEPGAVEELENHLRDKIEDLVNRGHQPKKAFHDAVANLSSGEEIEEEYMFARTNGNRPAAWKSRYWIPALLPNFLKTAFRNFWRQKSITTINIFGLAVGIACCIFIFLYIWDELSYDTFHEHQNRMFRVVETVQTQNQEIQTAYVENALGPALQQEFPVVEKSVRIFRGWRLTVGPVESAQIVRNYFITDTTFFDVFSFPLMWGDPETALQRPGSIVLSRQMLDKLYGDRNPVGESIRIEAEDFPEFGEHEFTITGVLQDIPANSHLKFDLLLSKSTVNRFEEWKSYFDSWEGIFSTVYLLLDDPTKRNRVEQKFDTLLEKHRGKEVAATKEARLQPLADIHFYSSDINAEINEGEGQLSYIYLFGLIAFLVLVIACINYVNLATARSVYRAKEIGLRKVAGAGRLQLVVQFIGESLLIGILGMGLAVIILLVALPYFNALAGKAITMEFFTSGMFIWGSSMLILVIGLIAGIYPAVHLSGFQPANILKGTMKSDNSLFRKGLVVVQFTLSIIMIITTFSALRQMNFISEKNLGFNEEQLIVMDINHDDLQANYATVKEELLRSAAIHNVTVSSRVPGDWKNFRQVDTYNVLDGPENTVDTFFNGIDEDFLETYEVDLVDGRNFKRELASDTAAVIINETAARILFEGDALDMSIKVEGSDFEGRVVGVVKDFHYQSLHQKIQPLMLGFMPLTGRHPLHGIDYFTMRVNGRNIDQAVSHIRQVHSDFDSVNPIEYSFLDQWINNLYKQDRVVSRLFAIAAGLTILIACIGLFGLATFYMEKRTKEIGIRKVLGASIASILTLLSRNFLKLIGISFLISVPLAWITASSWMQNFAYHAEIGLGVIVISGIIALLVSMLTISWQAVRAATMNPANSLRNE